MSDPLPDETIQVTLYRTPRVSADEATGAYVQFSRAVVRAEADGTDVTITPAVAVGVIGLVSWLSTTAVELNNRLKELTGEDQEPSEENDGERG